MMVQRTALPLTLFLVLALATTGCGDDDDPGADHGDYDDIGFERQGLQPDPLADVDLPDNPDFSDAPQCIQDELDFLSTSSDADRLLLVEGQCNGDEYLYRAPVLDMLNDQEFAAALNIMAARTDRMGTATHGPANGGGGGDGPSFSIRTMLYTPDAPIYDPDADFDVDDNLQHISQQIDDGLAATDDDPLTVELTFRPTVRTWQHYVDVLDPDEVASQSVARDAGHQRREDYTADLHDVSIDAVDSASGCQVQDTHSHEHRGLYECTTDQIQLLTDLPDRVVDVQFTDELSNDGPNYDTPSNSTSNGTSNGGEPTNNGTSNGYEGGNYANSG